MAQSRFQQKRAARERAINTKQAALKPVGVRQTVPRDVKRAVFDIVHAARATQDVLSSFTIGEFYLDGKVAVVWRWTVMTNPPSQVRVNGAWVPLRHDLGEDYERHGRVSTGYKTVPSPPNPVPPGSWR